MAYCKLGFLSVAMIKIMKFQKCIMILYCRFSAIIVLYTTVLLEIDIIHLIQRRAGGGVVGVVETESIPSFLLAKYIHKLQSEQLIL